MSLEAHCDITSPGDTLILKSSSLNNWQGEVQFQTNSKLFPKWFLLFPQGFAGEYKLAIKRDGELLWEPISGNRLYTPAAKITLYWGQKKEAIILNKNASAYSVQSQSDYLTSSKAHCHVETYVKDMDSSEELDMLETALGDMEVNEQAIFSCNRYISSIGSLFKVRLYKPECDKGSVPQGIHFTSAEYLKADSFYKCLENPWLKIVSCQLPIDVLGPLAKTCRSKHVYLARVLFDLQTDYVLVTESGLYPDKRNEPPTQLLYANSRRLNKISKSISQDEWSIGVTHNININLKKFANLSHTEKETLRSQNHQSCLNLSEASGWNLQSVIFGLIHIRSDWFETTYHMTREAMSAAIEAMASLPSSINCVTFLVPSDSYLISARMDLNHFVVVISEPNREWIGDCLIFELHENEDKFYLRDSINMLPGTSYQSCNTACQLVRSAWQKFCDELAFEDLIMEGYVLNNSLVLTSLWH